MNRRQRWSVVIGCLSGVSLGGTTLPAQNADLVLHSGRIVTVDKEFRIAEAISIRGERIIAVGTKAEVLKTAGPSTELIDLKGATVLPGLIDSHVHATDAAVYEWDHVIPDMRSLEDVFEYITQRTKVVPEGEWITLGQVFITRLAEQRFPTRSELDKVAPNHPVLFRTGPDAALNTRALEASGIDEEFKISDGQPGYLERDPQSGKLNGILRSCTRLVKAKSTASPSEAVRAESLRKLLTDYNAIGITSICDRNVGSSGLKIYENLLEKGHLTCRVFMSCAINAQDSMDKIDKDLQTASKHPTHQYSNRLWMRGAKIFLDGGMLTGSAYMSKPWGLSSIYAINDPEYRGLLYVQPDKLFEIAKRSLAYDLQITAHSVGDGAIEALVDAYERVNEVQPIRDQRPCITHCNFLSVRAMDRMQKLGIVADLQPVWLWLDGRTLLKQFGNERMQWFQPYRELFDRGIVIGGGSDHMQKIGSLRSVNPYNPFLGMWIALKRFPRGMDSALRPEQRITREEMIRLYTINNAFLTFEEKEKGSLEPGKLADVVILDRDVLQCDLDSLKDTRVLKTYVGGELVYAAKP